MRSSPEAVTKHSDSGEIEQHRFWMMGCTIDGVSAANSVRCTADSSVNTCVARISLCGVGQRSKTTRFGLVSKLRYSLPAPGSSFALHGCGLVCESFWYLLHLFRHTPMVECTSVENSEMFCQAPLGDHQGRALRCMALPWLRSPSPAGDHVN